MVTKEFPPHTSSQPPSTYVLRLSIGTESIENRCIIIQRDLLGCLTGPETRVSTVAICAGELDGPVAAQPKKREATA